jgi:hypothetical protein
MVLEPPNRRVELAGAMSCAAPGRVAPALTRRNGHRIVYFYQRLQLTRGR